MAYFAMSISELDQGFLAGFLEGEASFVIQEQNGSQSYSCALSLGVRDDDQDLVEWLVATTGVGRLYRVPARATSRPQIAWKIDAQDECLEIDRMLSRCGFHGRRATELEIWSAALQVWTSGHGAERRATLRTLKGQLETARRFRGGTTHAAPFTDQRRLRLGYISGIVAAEGCFYFSRSRPRFSIHMRQDDRPLLDLLRSTTGFGAVYDHTPPPPLNPASAWTVYARPDITGLLAMLREADLPGRKRAEMETWAVAVDELESAHRLHVRPRKQLLCLSAEHLRALRTYRPSTRELLQLPRRDLRAESLVALRAWSEESDGRLSCGGYSRWRRDHPESPTRNTVARTFGSWYAAMEAAGLADRAARSVVTRAGRGAARRTRREEQRARVVAAVRRFEAEHGRLPRAMEFFRWRFEAAPDSPTQGTVYNLFPGGWADVLDACRAGYRLS